MENFEERIISTIEKVLPAVVSVAISKDVKTILSEAPYFNLFGLPVSPENIEEELEGAPRDEKGRIKLGGGSGFIVSPDGVILTNKHVVIDTRASYSVIDAKGATYEAAVLASDPINDIAILKIKAQNLPVVELEKPGKLKLGQTVIAFGNPLGHFQNSVSLGIVSGLSRLITAITDLSGHQERLRGLIQTDAAINPGNSGGPLINLNAKAIGINSAVVLGAQNIGFAIPIAQAIKDFESIKQFGRIRRPFLGIRYLILNKQIQKQFNLSYDNGAMVVNEGAPGDFAVIPDSPADKAGIKDFDVITHCNNKRISEEQTLEDLISKLEIGDKITLTVVRGNDTFEKEVVLKEFQRV